MGIICARLKRARNCSKIVAPISRLPADVLSRIFAILVGWDDLYCDHGLEPSESLKDWTSHATILSSVNAAWRNIRIESPSLWSQKSRKYMSTIHMVHGRKTKARPGGKASRGGCHLYLSNIDLDILYTFSLGI